MQTWMNTWFDYRAAWDVRPWMAVIAVVGVIMLVVGIVGTVTAQTIGFFFVPGLAVIYLHHVLVQRQVN